MNRFPTILNGVKAAGCCYVKFCSFIKRTHLEGGFGALYDPPLHKRRETDLEAVPSRGRGQPPGLFLSVSFAKHGDKSAQAPAFEAIGPKQVDV